MMTRQEMFDKAVRGMASQGFERCSRPSRRGEPGDYVCAYTDGCSHCAWGWVDESLEDIDASISTLQIQAIGLAGELDAATVKWAQELQECHDNGGTPESMVRRLREFAREHNLTFPDITEPNSEHQP